MYVPAGAVLGSDVDGSPVMLDHALVVLSLRAARDGWVLDYTPLREVTPSPMRAVSAPTVPVVSYPPVTPPAHPRGRAL